MRYTTIALTIYLSLNANSALAAMTLSSKNSICKANVSFTLPSVNIACNADPRSGNPSNWINPNTQCNMSFEMLSLPSLGDIAGGISGQICSALNGLKELTYDKALDSLQAKLPKDITDALDMNVDLNDTLSSMINDQLNSTVQQGQTAVGNANINANPSIDDIDNEISDMLDRDVCFSADDLGMISINCGENLVEQIATSSMSAQDKKSLKHTTLPINCKKDQYSDGNHGTIYNYSCLIKSQPYDFKKGYSSLLVLQKDRSDQNGCFIDNLNRSLCTRDGKGAINYNQGYFAATIGTLPTDCKKENGLYVCPASKKLDYKPIPDKCSYSTSNFYCDNIESAQMLVQDEFGCFATLGNQRSCLRPIDNWSPSYPIKEKTKSASRTISPINTTPVIKFSQKEQSIPKVQVIPKVQQNKIAKNDVTQTKTTENNDQIKPKETWDWGTESTTDGTNASDAKWDW